MSTQLAGPGRCASPALAALAAASVIAAAVGCARERRAPGEPAPARVEALPLGTGVAPACSAATELPAGASDQSLTSGGRQRRYVLYLPSSHDGRSPLPLVVELHGSGGTPEGQLGTSQLTALAEAERFAIVAPQALDGRWNVPPEAARADDVRFVAELLDDLEAKLCVERRRVFATGFSGGGRMASQLACELSGRIAAIAAVGGLRFPGPCDTARGVPVLGFHGTADTINPYAGGGQTYWGTSVEAALDGWGRHNGCGARRDSRAAPSVVQLAYGGGGCADAVLYRIEAFEHAWPGAIHPGRDGGTANELIWSFFSAHPLPAAP